MNEILSFVDPLTTITVVFFMRKNKKNVIFYREIFRFFQHHSTRIFDIFRYDIYVDFNRNNTKHHEI